MFNDKDQQLITETVESRKAIAVLKSPVFSLLSLSHYGEALAPCLLKSPRFKTDVFLFFLISVRLHSLPHPGKEKQPLDFPST